MWLAPGHGRHPVQAWQAWYFLVGPDSTTFNEHNHQVKINQLYSKTSPAFTNYLIFISRMHSPSSTLASQWKHHRQSEVFADHYQKAWFLGIHLRHCMDHSISALVRGRQTPLEYICSTKALASVETVFTRWTSTIEFIHSFIADHFSDPARAIGLINVPCICVCVWTINFEQNDCWPRHMACWFTLRLPRSSSKYR